MGQLDKTKAACRSHLTDARVIALQRLYREKGENVKHSYTLSGDLPEMVQAKLNARNLSEVKGVCLLCSTRFPHSTQFLHLLTGIFRAHTRNPG